VGSGKYRVLQSMLSRDISAHPSPTRLSMLGVALALRHSNNLMVRVV
jgi:hypothetical protein